MPITTLSFLPCARPGSGVTANAAITPTMVSFFSIFVPPTYFGQPSAVPRKRLTPLRRHRRQSHYGLGVVACSQVRCADLAQRRHGVAAMLVGQRTARCVGASSRAARLRRDRLGTTA